MPNDEINNVIHGLITNEDVTVSSLEEARRVLEETQKNLGEYEK